VARGYQVGIGIRPPHQTLKGTYTTTATKTLNCTARKIYSFLLTGEGQAVLLNGILYSVKIAKGAQFECEGGIFGEFRTVKPEKALRLTWINEEWPKKTVVNLHLFQKLKNKCMIAIDHSDLPTMKAKGEAHARWRKAVDEIYALLNEEPAKKEIRKNKKG